MPTAETPTHRARSQVRERQLARHAEQAADDGSRASRPPPLTARGQNTRRRLLAAATVVFGRDGFNDVRIIDVTRSAGVASGTFYTYFDSKEEIFREVAVSVLAEVSAAPRRDPENVEGDLIRDIEYATTQYFLACIRNAGVVRSIEQLTTQDAGVAAARQRVAHSSAKRAERWLRRLQSQGDADPSIEPWPTVLALHTMTVRVAYDQLVLHDEPVDVEPLVRAVTTIWARAVGLAR